MKRITLLLALAVITAGGFLPAALSTAASAQDTTGAEAQTVAFDVAEIGARFVFDPSFDDGSGLPLRGAAFVTEGYIYPAGTLTDTNGVLEDGSPEFPDMVLGQWICRGWVLQDLATITTGAMVITTQQYAFGAGDEVFTFVSDGEELADAGVAITRAVLGGTGPLSSVGGQVHQTLLGFNASQGVNLHFEAVLTFVEAGVDINALLTPIPMVGTPESEATPAG
jgi:hypothetical protein